MPKSFLKRLLLPNIFLKKGGGKPPCCPQGLGWYRAIARSQPSFLYFKIFSFKQYYSPWEWRRRTCPARAGAWASRRRWCSGWALRWAMARGRRSCGSIAAGCGYCGPACCSSHCRPAGSCSRSSAAAVAPSRSWLHIAKATIRYNCFSILVYQIREVVKRYIFGLHLLNTK